MATNPLTLRGKSNADIAAVSPAPQPNIQIIAKCPCKSQGRDFEIRKIAYVVHLRTRLRWTYRRTLADVATRPWQTPRLACRRSRAIERPGVCQRSINGCHAVASSGCLWRCLSRRASKNSRNVLYCAAIASLIARNSFVASVSIVDSFHFKWGAYFWWDQSSLFYWLPY